MTNKEIYKKTIGFSVRRLLFGLISMAVLAGICALGFVLTDQMLANPNTVTITCAVIAAVIVWGIIHSPVCSRWRASQLYRIRKERYSFRILIRNAEGQGAKI